MVNQLIQIINILNMAMALYHRVGYERARRQLEQRLNDEMDKRDDRHTESELERVLGRGPADRLRDDERE